MIVRLLERKSLEEKEDNVDKKAIKENKENKNNKDKITEKDLEDSLERDIDFLEEEFGDGPDGSRESADILYSFGEEQFLMEQFYDEEQVRYERSLYKQRSFSRFESEDEYTAMGKKFQDTEAEILTTEEAEDAMIEIQYAAVIGTANDISSEKKRKFDMWIKFNPALFKLFEASYAVTSNVDYKPLA